jgi:hypothetical protein
MESEGACLSTIFFKNSKSKDKNLILVDSQKQKIEDDNSEIWKKQLNTFKRMIK